MAVPIETILKLSGDLVNREMIVGEKSTLVDRSISSSDLKNKYGVLVVGIKKESGEVMINPEATAVIHSGDTLVITGENESLNKVQQICV